MKTLKKLTCIALSGSVFFLLLNSCSKERLDYFKEKKIILDNYPSPTNDNTSSNILEQYTTEDNYVISQHFVFEAGKQAQITAQAGTVIVIEPNSFVNDNGTNYDGNIDLELKEVYNKKDMILSDRPSTAGDSILESGGEIYIDAKDANGNSLQLAKDKTIRVEVPCENPANDMKLFRGEELAKNEFDWIESNDATSTIEPTDSMYLIYVNFLGWVNVDRYTGNCSGGGCGGLVCGPYKTNVILYYQGLNPGDSTIVYLIFPDHLSAVKAELHTGITSQFFKAKGIPIGTEIIIFALTYSANYAYYMEEYVTTITENYSDTLKLKPVSETQVLNFLNSI